MKRLHEPEPESERRLCTGCLRAISVCYCADLKPISLPFQVVILQHPKERKNSIGTARLTHLSLKESLLIGGVGFDDDPRVVSLLENPDHHCVLLYPGPDALDLGKGGSELLASTKKLIIFVIDGTWAHAKTMLRKSPRLLTLPRVAFDDPSPSIYQVRRQPNSYCLSTVEAVHRLIEALRPTAGASHLMILFQRIVQQQLEFASANQLREVRGKRKSVSPRPLEKLNRSS